jgi:rod shape-determining protein MreD
VKKLLLPLLFLFFFILDSLFVQFLPATPFGSNKIWVPHFLLSAIFFLTIYAGKKIGIIFALIFGLLYDIVYIEIIGINLFLFPFVAYLVSKMMNVLQTNIIIAFLTSLLGIAFLEVGVYEMDYLIHVANLDFMSFIKMRFYPTLILNGIFLILAGYPLKRHFEKFSRALRDE